MEAERKEIVKKGPLRDEAPSSVTATVKTVEGREQAVIFTHCRQRLLFKGLVICGTDSPTKRASWLLPLSPYFVYRVCPLIMNLGI